MRIDIITVHPGLLEGPFSHSILKRAQQKDLLEICIHDLREYGQGRHRQVDDYAYGGGAGMVMMIEPVHRCLSDLQKSRTYDEVIYLSPDGQRFTQAEANRLSTLKNLVLLCGHYKGVDERIREHLVSKEISIGDYVLSGGELPAAVLVDAIGRLLPGVLNDETSALSDSFQDGLIAPPVYTRPSEYEGWSVPDVLLSGHDERIRRWRESQSRERTNERRPDLLDDDDDIL